MFSEVTRMTHHVPEIPCWSKGPRWAVSKPRGLWCMFWNRPNPDLLYLLHYPPKKRRIKVTRSAQKPPFHGFSGRPQKNNFLHHQQERQRAHRPLPTPAHPAVPLLSAPRRWPALGVRGCKCLKELSSKSWNCNSPGGSQKGGVTSWEGQTVAGVFV